MNRLLRRALPFAAFLALAGVLLWLVAEAFTAANARSREYRYLSEAVDPVAEPATAVTWLPPKRPLVRPLSTGDEILIGRALSQAWRAFAAAQDFGQTAVLAEHFSGPALHRAETAAAQGYAGDTRMVVLDQTARPWFQHLDGSTFQLTASMTVVRFRMTDDAVTQFDLTRDEVTTTLTNETTGWRIFSHERHGATALSPTPRGTITLPRLRGINYYPAHTPWSRFWPEFDESIVAADLDRVRQLNGNSVRIFLPVADFAPDTTGTANIRKLQAFLDLAQDRDLSVIATLFDLKPGYRSALWAEDVAYLRRVLPVLAASPAVVLVDLKNEPDLDRAAQGKGLVDAWLATMIRMSRLIAPDLPLTIGWSSADSALDQAPLLDAISYHDYAPPKGTADRLARIRAQANGKPVLVTELGVSSYSLALGWPGSPARQAAELGDRIADLSPADGILVWTLHDFSAAEARAVGASPWVRRLQSRFGLLGLDGTEKPAAAIVAAAFASALD